MSVCLSNKEYFIQHYMWQSQSRAAWQEQMHSLYKHFNVLLVVTAENCTYPWLLMFLFFRLSDLTVCQLLYKSNFQNQKIPDHQSVTMMLPQKEIYCLWWCYCHLSASGSGVAKHLLDIQKWLCFLWWRSWKMVPSKRSPQHLEVYSLLSGKKFLLNSSLALF